MTETKLTAKQEAFCRLVAEGSTYSAAYRASYDAENTKKEVVWVKASELMANGKVLVRVNELKEEAADASKVTIKSIALELDENRQLALNEGQAAAATSATTAKAKLYGLFEKDNAQKGSFPPVDVTVNYVDSPNIPDDSGIQRS